MSRSTTVPTLLLCAGAIAAAFVAAELVVRAAVPVPYRPPVRAHRSDAWRTLLHRPSAVPGLDYELAPNASKPAVGTVVETNSLGMRDAEPREGPDVVRIAAIGDSYTFGFGVAAEEAYPDQLERLLYQQPLHTGRQYDVFNLGVGGYATRDEALVFEHKALPLHPDAVIIGYYLNDPETEPVQPLHEHFAGTRWWQHSSLLRLIAMHRYGREVEKYGGGDYYRYLHHQPEKWQSVVDGFERMGDLARDAGLPVLAVIFPATPEADWADYPYADLHDRVAALARSHGFRVVDLLESFAAHEPAALRQSARDRHPTPLAHAVAAREIRDALAGVWAGAPVAGDAP